MTGSFWIWVYVVSSFSYWTLRHSLKTGLGLCIRCKPRRQKATTPSESERKPYLDELLVAERKMISFRPNQKVNIPVLAYLAPSYVSNSSSPSKLPNTHQLIVETRANNCPLSSLLLTLNRLHITSIVHALVLFELRQHAESPFAREALSRASGRFEPHDPRTGVHAARQQRV